MAKLDNMPSRTVVDGSISLIDTLKAKGDTMIETTLYEFTDENIITRIVDSVLKYDHNGSMSLTYYTSTKDSTEYIQQKFRLLNATDIEHMRGVYYNHKIGKPLFIINLEDSDITDLSLSNTGCRVVVPCQTARENAIQVETLGYIAHLRIRDDELYEYGLYYDYKPISREPCIADKFKWINPSWTKDSLMEREDYKSRKEALNSYYESKKRGFSRNFEITDNHDTIIAYESAYGDPLFKNTYKVPIYEFNESYNGKIIKRLCDSISENDIFLQHSITGRKLHGDSLNTIVVSNLNLQSLIDSNELGGVIFNYNKKSPISVENLPEEFLYKFGIIKTDRTVTVIHTNPWNLLWIDADGLNAWITLMPEKHLKVYLQFWTHPLDKDLAKPFMWLIDQ